MSQSRITVFTMVVVALAGASQPASAQPLGVYRWQLQPFCNVVTVTITQHGGIYTLDGTDDRCGAGQAASAVGVAFLNPNGTVGFGLTTVLPGGIGVHLEAAIDPGTLHGTWRDSAGNAGPWILTPGAGVAGIPRPVTPGIVPAGAISSVHLASGAVTAAALASNAVSGATVLDSSLTRADIGDAPRAAFASGNQDLQLTSSPIVVRSVLIVAPAAGRVLVAASGHFSLTSNVVSESAFCSITTATVLDNSHTMVVTEASAAAMASIQVSGTRGFDVAAGATTFNLVCQEIAGNVNVSDSSLTALFVAGS